MIPSRDFLERALCTQIGHDPFFTDGKTGEAAMRNRQAKRICAACDVQQRCLEMALDQPASYDQHGVFGGLTVGERNKIRKQRGEGMAA